jgi:DNA polymerase-3 subunit gamma/tau
MLSKSAFNGLLKILEEPPPHTVFVFATTEPNRIPDTILSRVQRFDFRMLSDEEIRKRLQEMAEAERIPCEEDALGLMSRYAFGSMRDGQSIFEQAAVSGSDRITASLVEEMLGLVGTEAAIDLAGAAVSGDAGEAIGKLSALLSRGADMKYLYLSLVDVLRDAAVWKFTEDDRLLFRHSPSSLSRVKELCALRSREEWMFLLDIAFRSEKDVLGTEFPRLGFELLLLRLVNAPGLLDVVGMAEDSGPPKGPSQTTFARRPMPAPASAQAGAPPRHPSPAASPGAEVRKGREGDLWDALLKNLGAKKKTVLLLGLLSQMKGRREGDELVIASPHQFVLDRLREEDKWPVLLQAVAEVAGKKLEVRLVVSGEKKSPEAGGAVGKEEDRPEKRALSDPLLTEVLREFEGATILEVRPAPGGAPIPGAAGAGEPVLDESGEDEGEGR